MQSLVIGSFIVCFSCFSWCVDAKDRIDINIASADELDKHLIQIGPRKAEAIVAYRKENGPFKSPKDLAAVKGINLKIVEKNQDLIDVGETMAPARKVRHENTVKPID